jgi:hypothetical protein
VNRPVAGTEAALDPDWQTKYGVPVYTGPNGQLFTLRSERQPDSVHASDSGHSSSAAPVQSGAEGAAGRLGSPAACAHARRHR